MFGYDLHIFGYDPCMLDMISIFLDMISMLLDMILIFLDMISIFLDMISIHENRLKMHQNHQKPLQTTPNHTKWSLKTIWSGLRWFLMIVEHFLSDFENIDLGAIGMPAPPPKHATKKKKFTAPEGGGRAEPMS